MIKFEIVDSKPNTLNDSTVYLINDNNLKRMKTREQLAEDFFDSVYRIIKGLKKKIME